jgi:hypothetical protein
MGNAWATNTPADATITVTPIANVSLAISPTTYAYGALSVNTSSVTATALALSNNGDVNVTVDKRITNQSNPGGWTAAGSQGADQYVLSVTTSAARPAAGDFTAATQFGALSNVTNLTGAAGTQPTITVSGGALPSVDLWFKLDMPTTVSSQSGREITVRFTGTAQ